MVPPAPGRKPQAHTPCPYLAIYQPITKGFMIENNDKKTQYESDGG
jgi:hypothetical protein